MRQAGGEQSEGWGRVPTHSGFKTGSPVFRTPLGLGQGGQVGLPGAGESFPKSLSHYPLQLRHRPSLLLQAWNSPPPCDGGTAGASHGVERRDWRVPGLIDTCGDTHFDSSVGQRRGPGCPQPSLATKGGCVRRFVGYTGHLPPFSVCPSLSQPGRERLLGHCLWL